MQQKSMKILLLWLCSIAVMQMSFAQSNTNVNDLFFEANQYLLGNGKHKDLPKALLLFQKCADSGHIESVNIVGNMYKKGKGASVNFTKARDYFTKAVNLGSPKGFYNLAVMAKDGNGESINYEKAYRLFEKAANLKDEEAIYALGYMHYKGLGCTQDYSKAVYYFQQGAKKEMPNSMYFYGLCLRNGYGVKANEDSARFWLTLSAIRGYKMAVNELRTKKPENSNQEAIQLSNRIMNAASPTSESLNKYKKIEHHVNGDEIEGQYEGYLIRYDWSGQNPIGSTKLNLTLFTKGNKINGMWTENDSVSVNLEGNLTPRAINFKNTEYSRTDHYSMGKRFKVKFENAKLRWIKKDDSVYLVGNVQMFSIGRNEPEKPVSIALVRTSKAGSAEKIYFTNEDGSLYTVNNDLNAYPNPFLTIITLDFELAETCKVQTQLLTIEGKIIYSNYAGILEAGSYTIPIKTQDVAAGTYILRLQYGNKTKASKVIKY